MKQFYFLLANLIQAFLLTAQNQVPVISNFSLQLDAPNNGAVLHFDLSDAENDSLEVSVLFSADGGKSFVTLSGGNISGDTGFPVFAGSKTATCSGLNYNASGTYVFRVIADDRKPFDIQALVNEVDSNRLRDNLKFFEGIRHRTAGLAHLNETRDSIQSAFYYAGLFFQRHSFPFSNTTGQNLIGSLAGTASAEKVVIVDAHYDTVNIAPGADDNGSGTVGMLEVARLLSRYPSKKTQRYIGFDLEESNLSGSINYNSSGIPASEQIEGVFNFEMIGYWSDEPNSQTLPQGFDLFFPIQSIEVANNQYRGDFITNVGNSFSQALMLLYSTSAQQYVPGLKVISVESPGNGLTLVDLARSDHAAFWGSGRKALMLTDGANFRNECYHTAMDVAEDKLNFTFMSNVVKATVAAMAQLVEIQHADWADASFLVQVGTSEPENCNWQFRQESGFLVASGDCPTGGAVEIACFDLKGARIADAHGNADEGEIRIALPQLPAGMYVIQISRPDGVFSQKIFLR